MPEKTPTITMDSTVRFPSTWREAKGKKLTNKAIEKYRRQGRYVGMIVPPPKLGGPCVRCGTCVETRRYSYLYLPSRGFYCDACIEHYKDERDKLKELRRRIREERETEYV